EKATQTESGADSSLTWANLGDAYRWTPDNEERARESYGRALRLLAPKLEAAPSDWTLVSRRALYLAKSGECADALAAVEELPTEAAAAARYRAAVALEACGRREGALAALEAALGAGYPFSEAESNPELLELRRDLRFDRLASRFKEG
ncbi:MAG: hypothetical protein AAF725_27425, partial [Acidobacteriota bacterium]